MQLIHTPTKAVVDFDHQQAAIRCLLKDENWNPVVPSDIEIQRRCVPYTDLGKAVKVTRDDGIIYEHRSVKTGDVYSASATGEWITATFDSPDNLKHLVALPADPATTQVYLVDGEPKLGPRAPEGTTVEFRPAQRGEHYLAEYRINQPTQPTEQT